jgi:two-component system, sensor histidine kinase and response regulator
MESDFRILIVDDIPHNIDIIRIFLEGKYILEEANTGEEALEKLPLFRPDLILLDVKLPGLSGYEVCEKIRQQEEYNYVKIMIVSALTMVDERLKGYEVGADDYITKPFVAEELEAKIRVFLNLKRTKEIDKLKTDLLALFSHETRTPLYTIIGMSSLLLEDDSLTEDVRETVSMIIESGKQLQHFVEKTTFLCTLKGGTKAEKQREKILTQIQNVLEAATPLATAKGVQCQTEIDPQAVLEADWTMILEILTYLINNAIKFSPEGGRVNIRWTTTDGHPVLEISDQGKGIPTEWLGKIFDEFAIQDIMHHQKGQGLSLAIARHVMNLHNGTIKAENNSAGGATFKLSFPAG